MIDPSSASPVEAEFLTTKQGHPAVLVGGHLFHKQYVHRNSSRIGWRCSQFHKHKCNCVCITRGDKVFIDQSQIHNHETIGPKTIEMMKIRKEVKRKGIANIDDKPLHVLTTTIEEMAVEIDYDEYHNLRRVMYRRRLKASRKAPKTKNDAIDILSQMCGGDDPVNLVRAVESNIQ